MCPGLSGMGVWGEVWYGKGPVEGREHSGKWKPTFPYVRALLPKLLCFLYVNSCVCLRSTETVLRTDFDAAVSVPRNWSLARG